MNRRNALGGAIAALLLAGCSVMPAQQPVALATPAQWYAPLPHAGQLAKLADWWREQNDPLLVELIMAAEAVSPSIAEARSNIEQARATRVASGAATLPKIDGTANLTRSRAGVVNGASLPVATSGQAGVQASWEIDLFGQYAATRAADQQRLEGSQALWHAARVSVAAEVANQYYSRRACERLLAVAQSDATSRAETARLAELSRQAGFQAPATAALARASAAEGHANASQQASLCELDLKALVALTALDEPALRQKLASTPSDLTFEPPAPVVSVPAEVLAQRPDIFNAARELDAAHAEIGNARALLYPKLGLSGSIGRGKNFSPGASPSFETWSLGPLQLTVPLFDGAARANIDAAEARYVNAAAQYRGKARQAVREVEEALVNLQGTAERSQDAAIATEGYRASYTGTEARYKGGLASLVELEDSRRTLLAAQTALVNLQRERRNAWVALYRALGGGWNAELPPVPKPAGGATVPPATATSS